MSRLGRARGLIGGEWRLAVPTSTVAIVGVMVLLIVGAIGAMVRTAGHEDEDVVTQLTPPPSGSFAPVPEFRHAYVIVFENKSLEQFLASPDQAPTFFALRHRYASFDACQGVAHPSQPNYLAMIAGSTLGIHGNAPKDVAGTTILDRARDIGSRLARLCREHAAGLLRRHVRFGRAGRRGHVCPQAQPSDQHRLGPGVAGEVRQDQDRLTGFGPRPPPTSSRSS